MWEERRQQLKKLWDSRGLDRARFARLQRLANEDGAGLTPPFMDETPEQWQMRQRFCPGFLPSALATLSYLYAQPPVRQVERPDACRAIWWGEPDDGLDTVLFEADPMVRLGGTALAVVLPVEGERRLRASVLEADRFVVVPDPLHPQQVGAAWIRWTDPLVSSEVGMQKPTEEESTWVYMDATVMVSYQPGRDPLVVPHNYGRCPAVVLKNSISSKSLLGQQMGGKDLEINLRTLNQYGEQLLYVGELQRGQPVLVGKKEVTISPTTPVEVDQVGGFSYVSNGANIAGMMQVYQAALDAVAAGLLLPKATWSVRPTLDGGSAGAIYAVQLELGKDRSIRERLGLVWEFGLHRLARVVAQAAFGVDIGALTGVRYTPFIAPSTVGEQIAKSKTEAELGLADREKLAADLNPGIPPEEVGDRVELATEQRERDMQLAIQEAGHSELAAFDVGQ